MEYQKTEGYYVYAHITPDGLFYIGTSGMQPSDRWNSNRYKRTALEPFIEQYGWDNIKHFIFKDGLTREQAMQLEDLLIQEATDKGYCINRQRSGLIKVTDKNAYQKQYNKQRRATPKGKIYNRVTAFNQKHPDLMIETPKEARDKYLATGYIPSYIKNDDLN